MKFFRMLAGAVSIFFCTCAYSSMVMDFEDLYSGGPDFEAPLPTGYFGFDWSASAYLQTLYVQPWTGYEFGTFGDVSIFNSDESDLTFSRGDLFTLESAYLTSAWNINETVTVQGLRGGALLNSVDLMISFDMPQLFNFNFVGIDTVRIMTLPSDGINAGLGGQGSHVVIDNIQFSDALIVAPPPTPGGSVPAPGMLVLCATALCGCMAVRRYSK